MKFEVNKLKTWFLSEKRDLPWRNHPTPYVIWISEVMLQQTQVAVVIPYFLRWMEKFPTVYDLASAPLDEVIKTWEGLGYYSRARHLHEGAKYIVTEYQGRIPQTEEELKKIKGLGPYTIGALLSFAFHQKKAAVDGNVLRVLSRYFNIHDDITKTPTVKKLRLLAESLLPDEKPWVINEAFIELGATICQKKANCSICPINLHCSAYQLGTVDKLPIKSKGAKTTYLYRSVTILTHDDHYLIRRGQKGEIMNDLHEFPFIETTEEGKSEQQLKKWIQKEFGLAATLIKVLADITHSFTRYQARLRPVLFECSEKSIINGFKWVHKDEFKQLAFSSGHRRILQQLQVEFGSYFD